jgi:tetratricopeptide (TPR) repeat protein
MTLALGCASGPMSVDRSAITPDELLAGAALGVQRDSYELIGEEKVLALSAEMRDFLDSHVDRRAIGPSRLRQLAWAITGEAKPAWDYDDKTRTAAETFRARRGNCLSFSNMFVAMARNLNLDVHFQEVDIPPDWTRVDGAFVLNRHVNVLVYLGWGAEDQVVDFNIDDFKSSYDTRLISDARALAHFNNNMGVERMQAGDTASALAYFRRAIDDNDRRFAPAWINLGILYLRSGHAAHAEAAYLQALRVNRRDFVAMSNLANLYERQGNAERAAKYRKKVTYHRKRNPYYRHLLAREAFAAKDYDAAISHLRYAIRKKETEDQFYYLLGLAHLAKGNDRIARRWLERAEAVAATDALKGKYRGKIDDILSAAP